MSFKEVREIIAYFYADAIISDDEFVLLYYYFHSKNPDFTYEYTPKFDFDKLLEAESKENFRVEKKDLHALANALPVPRKWC